MRTRSDSTQSETLRTGHIMKPPGGGWFKGLKLFRSRAPDGVNTPSTTDGHHSPVNEEPRNAIVTFEQNLENRSLYEASLMLREREERLFGEITAAGGRSKEEVDKLAADYRVLERHVLQTLQQSLSGEVSVEALTSAVKAVHLQDEQDHLWKQRDETPPGWRSGGWKELHDSTLQSLVKDRMDNPSTPPAHPIEQSSFEADIHSMARQLKQDLTLVVEVVKTCYPPEADICNFYARLYHKIFSARLRKIADFGLEDKDCTFLLRWVNEFYPGLLQNPKLAAEINSEALGKLLSQELLEPLEEQYLNKQQGELTTYIIRVLDEAKARWNNGEEPAREDGCYTSPVAYDIIQLTNGMVTSAETVVGDLHKAQSITRSLSRLMQSFKIFQDEVIKQNKPISKAFIKANLGSVEQFSDVFKKNGRLFVGDVRENCLSVLTYMKESAHAYLLSPVHEGLRPQYRKLGTSDWLTKPLFEDLLVSIEAEIHELKGSKESCHQELICQFHQEVTVEYVRRLLKGEVKLKDKERQHKAFVIVKDNAESLHNLFVRMGSKEDWLKEILTKIAEVLKLQGLPTIQMQVASLGIAFPDLSEKHVSALLKLKTNLSRDDRRIVKATLMDTLKDTAVADARPFFSKVRVK